MKTRGQLWDAQLFIGGQQEAAGTVMMTILMINVGAVVI
jgi:hypothetical protein